MSPTGESTGHMSHRILPHSNFMLYSAIKASACDIALETQCAGRF